MFCVGLTGNIGSGKSTVLHLFHELGVTTASADAVARSLTARGEPCFQEIIRHFGASVLTEQGELNRAQLRKIISHNPTEKAWLEALLHPKIQGVLGNIAKQPATHYVMLEIPLLFSLAAYPFINRVLLVSAPETVQITRIMQRDKTSPDQARAMLNMQPKLQTRRALANDELCNDGDLAELKKQVLQLHHLYTTLSNAKPVG